MLKAVTLTSGQVFTPKKIQGESVLWRRRLLLFVRLKATLQSSYDLSNNRKASIVIETSYFDTLLFFLASVT